MAGKTGSVFSIPPGLPFLDTLVAALLEGRLGFDVDPAGDPFALADITLYLPTRRAVRAVRTSFLNALGRPVLLPQIRALGDVDEDGLALEQALFGLGLPDLPPAVPAAHRQLALTSLVLPWSAAAVRAEADPPDEPLLVPASPADAARLADRLGRLIDEVHTAGVNWDALAGLVDKDLAQYWEITREFLEIATAAWPAHLAERGLIDPAARRDALIRAEAVRLGSAGSDGPVIAAGSTGSVPATADLLAAIAGLSNGAVVLPGLDTDLDDDAWSAVDCDDEPARLGHPQYGLKRLLAHLQANREDIAIIGAPPPALATRAEIVSQAMRPADMTDAWTEHGLAEISGFDDALAGVTLIEAANEREEALAIALVLRETLEAPDRTAALITPDRALARRVAVELRRWGIAIDDSGGVPLNRTPHGVLARLVAEAAFSGLDALTILALLKHPLTALGTEPAAIRRAARALERAVFRGPKIRPGAGTGITALRTVLENRRREVAAGDRTTVAATDLTPDEFNAAAALLDTLETALAPLNIIAVHEPGAVPLSDLVAAHLASLQAVTKGSGSADEPAMAQSDAGTMLAAMMAEFVDSVALGPDIRPSDYPGLFSSIAGGQTFRSGRATDPRIHIWGALEARLQHVDVAILGGLNEGSWPAPAETDPFLSRSMRTALGLDPPEGRIGQSAHDFAQGLGLPVVWLSRANRQDGEPRTASRWLQRLIAYIGEDEAKALKARGQDMLVMARDLDMPPGNPQPAERPRPAPPLPARPNRLSVTRIETLIRDPYAIYAENVLGLRPIEDIAAMPGPAERGTVFHDALERFIAERPEGPFDAVALERLLAIGAGRFADFADTPEIQALWWPRFERMARWFVTTEEDRTDIEDRMVERNGAMAIGDDFTLTVRADRIDRLTGGRLGIVDYKTGAPPSARQVLSISPQLLLEAVIVLAGGFSDMPDGDIARLDYYRVSGADAGGEINSVGTRKANAKKGEPEITLPQAIDLTRARVTSLIAAYRDSDRPYLSRARPVALSRFVGDYDHLARVGEWSIGAEDEE
jgi:ATP-dependent helicase/nuclease subunit B